jgi:hypothetical protein
MIFILGIDHRSHQFWSPFSEDSILNLENELNAILKKEKIELIAEEFSLEAGKLHNVEKTTTQKFSESKNIPYMFVDPDSNERKGLGIRSRKDTADKLGIDIFNCTKEEVDEVNTNHKDADQLREREWLRRISSYASMNIIFLCGFEHVSSFKDLAIQSGYYAQISKVVE